MHHPTLRKGGMFMDSPVYALGHSDGELERLTVQSRFVEPITRQFFQEAGISAGMRVLDVGSGAGDVAFLTADLVGETGEVIGTDKAAAALTRARQRAADEGLHNVSFRAGDPTEIAFDRPFDAVVGRYVLLFQADPARMVRALMKQHLRPGGLIVFHEPDWTNVRSFPPAPTYDRCCRWIVEAFRGAGTDTNAANNLYTAFAGAGLPSPQMRMQTFVGGNAGCADWLQVVAGLAASLLPMMEQLGIATAADLEITTLAQRLQREVTTSEHMIIGRSEIAAWSRL
jgi:ubiquinone/menaquinone biosynthesis C-methylase UbiE